MVIQGYIMVIVIIHVSRLIHVVIVGGVIIRGVIIRGVIIHVGR